MKELSKQDAFIRLSGLCANAEHCSYDMLQKMKRWGLDEESRTWVIEKLQKEKFIDEERYCRFFVKDKIKYNKWGRRKIEQALWMKRIPTDIQNNVLDEIDDNDYLKVLKPLISNKKKSIKAENEYEANGKLIKFALSRGFSMELIKRCINNTDEYNIDEEKFLE